MRRWAAAWAVRRAEELMASKRLNCFGAAYAIIAFKDEGGLGRQSACAVVSRSSSDSISLQTSHHDSCLCKAQELALQKAIQLLRGIESKGIILNWPGGGGATERARESGSGGVGETRTRRA